MVARVRASGRPRPRGPSHAGQGPFRRTPAGPRSRWLPPRSAGTSCPRLRNGHTPSPCTAARATGAAARRARTGGSDRADPARARIDLEEFADRPTPDVGRIPVADLPEETAEARIAERAVAEPRRIDGASGGQDLVHGSATGRRL